MDSLFVPEACGQAMAAAGLLAARVRDYFRDPANRRKFEAWHLEAYGEPYLWKPLEGTRTHENV